MVQLLNGIQSTSSALSAERVRMDVVAQNIANANTTHGLDGKPYQRQQVIFEAVLKQQQQQAGAPGVAQQGVQISRIEKDQRPSRMVYNPTHPDADAHGMVSYPNVDIHTEMVDLIAASRSFEANLAV
ncbi:MAG: flagellar basal body rod protein FlgC, partial [Verrucomicrobia bacterium]|nr:flagellar basal body rod protein FlgC [Verrucomicrobiota bacterium]